MIPDPREIAAVLAASPAVQEALRRCEAGWEPWDAAGETMWELVHASTDDRLPYLPVDPTAIVAEAARIRGEDKIWALAQNAGGMAYGADVSDRHGRYLATVHEATPRLAAIALLVAVVEARRE